MTARNTTQETGESASFFLSLAAKPPAVVACKLEVSDTSEGRVPDNVVFDERWRDVQVFVFFFGGGGASAVEDVKTTLAVRSVAY